MFACTISGATQKAHLPVTCARLFLKASVRSRSISLVRVQLSVWTCVSTRIFLQHVRTGKSV